MKLQELIKVLPGTKTYGNLDKEIQGISYDSRQVKQDCIFVCIQGYNENAVKYVPDAIARGASVIVSKEKVNAKNITQIIVPDARRALALLSVAFYGNPSRNLNLIGITGTNGKTTITYLLEAILSESHCKVGVISTVDYRINDKSIPSSITTPQSSDLQCMFSEMVQSGCKYAVMEVSSHALELERVTGCEFDVAVFTNLTQDHLDFHETLEKYLNAKLKLFSSLNVKGEKNNPRYAVVNIDDEAGRQVIQNTRVDIITYGIDNDALVKAKNIQLCSEYTCFDVVTGKGCIDIKLKLLGLHNVYNALASIAVGLGQNISLEVMREGLKKMKNIPGRFELIEGEQDFSVVVDYAHTPDALQRTLLTAKELHPKRIITVFGCGGDRDRKKRPLMGQIAAQLSDYCIITTDNPRKEDPVIIALDIEVGIRKVIKDDYKIILDRYEALTEALHYAKSGDIVIIAGKGHESYQIVMDEKIHYNDTEAAKEILGKMYGKIER